MNEEFNRGYEGATGIFVGQCEFLYTEKCHYMNSLTQDSGESLIGHYEEVCLSGGRCSTRSKLLEID